MLYNKETGQVSAGDFDVLVLLDNGYKLSDNAGGENSSAASVRDLVQETVGANTSKTFDAGKVMRVTELTTTVHYESEAVEPGRSE